jgi:hypothetical protein
MTTNPRLGDKQSCAICGEEAEFKRLTPPDAYAVGDDGALRSDCRTSTGGNVRSADIRLPPRADQRYRRRLGL